MTLSYRSPHHKVTPSAHDPLNPVDVTAARSPLLPPAQARDADWLMAHVVDVIAAGPLYDGKLSPVWAQMVRLYAQYLGVIRRPSAAPATGEERTPRRRRIEEELSALAPDIASMMEAQQDSDDREDAEYAEEAGLTVEPAPACEPPLPSQAEREIQAEARAEPHIQTEDDYLLAPLARLDDAGAMREALGHKPRRETLTRVIKLALDETTHRAIILRRTSDGSAAPIPRAEALAHRLHRKWDPWFFQDQSPEIPELDDLPPDLFETKHQAWRRLYYRRDGKPPN